jgi:hypothetical protein
MRAMSDHVWDTSEQLGTLADSDGQRRALRARRSETSWTIQEGERFVTCLYILKASNRGLR